MLVAAMKLLVDKQLSGRPVTMREIAQEVGRSTSSVRDLWGNVEHLLAAARLRLRAEASKLGNPSPGVFVDECLMRVQASTDDSAMAPRRLGLLHEAAFSPASQQLLHHVLTNLYARLTSIYGPVSLPVWADALGLDRLIQLAVTDASKMTIAAELTSAMS